jgi:hypothetical protein
MSHSWKIQEQGRDKEMSQDQSNNLKAIGGHARVLCLDFLG